MPVFLFWILGKYHYFSVEVPLKLFGKHQLWYDFIMVIKG